MRGQHRAAIEIPLDDEKEAFTGLEWTSGGLRARPTESSARGGGGRLHGSYDANYPPPPQRGLWPTDSCQRYEPKEPMSAVGAPAPKAPNGGTLARRASFLTRAPPVAF